VLNGFTNITEENSRRVRKAVEELGYEKCRSAEMLVARRRGSSVRSGNIGVIFAGMRDEWASHQLVVAYTMGAERACSEKGFHALVELTADDEKLPRCIQEGKVDGLIIKTTRAISSFVQLLPADLPVVVIGYDTPCMPIQQVAPDNRGAGWMMTEYLWNLGHRRIAFLCTDALHPVFLNRLHGYESFLRMHHGYDPALVAMGEETRVSLTPEVTPPKMDALLDRVMSAASPPTAVIAPNDWVAFGTFSAIAARGLRVPQDISVVGFDNDASICNSCIPPLTSYSVPFDEVAYRAALELFERIERPTRRLDMSIQLLHGTVRERASVRAIDLPASA
jgi:LacI family transcriptional regulator